MVVGHPSYRHTCMCVSVHRHQGPTQTSGDVLCLGARDWSGVCSVRQMAKYESQPGGHGTSWHTVDLSLCPPPLHLHPQSFAPTLLPPPLPSSQRGVCVLGPEGLSAM